MKCKNCGEEINENLGFCSTRDCIIMDTLKQRKLEKWMEVILWIIRGAGLLVIIYVLYY